MKSFWDKVEKTNTCWLWKAASRGNGYGCFKYQGKVYNAHRFVWFLIYGVFSKNFICHRCDIRKCVNPDHLFEGTQADNVKDAITKDRIYKIKNEEHVRGEKHYNVKLNEKLVIELRNIYNNKKISLRDLASQYGIAYSTMRYAIKGKSWKHIMRV